MDDICLPNALFYGWFSSSTRQQGHPLLHYKESLKTYLKICQINLKIWEVIALNKTQ
uniref:Uncharacterized protein n=1 Tax=Octopus bimaculoides TaxID=37653 RepID=A0A0L8GI09_OCTBM